MNRLEWVFSIIIKSKKLKLEKQTTEYLLWGTGNYGKTAVNLLSYIGIRPLAYIDCDREKQGKSFYGKIIMSPERALHKYAGVMLILAMSEIVSVNLRKELEMKGIYSVSIIEFMLTKIESLSVLEIGPLHNPFFKGENVKYMDAFDADKLREIAQIHNLPTNMIPKHIDYVSPDGEWKMIDESFDFVYSSHLIEHQTNFVRHLQNVYAHLHYGGAYVLVVPDKRYCFDHYAPSTTLEDVLSAYYEKRKRHSFTALLRAVSATHNDACCHWQGNHGETTRVTRKRLDALADQYFSSLRGEYIDAHEWYFTPASFKEICMKLKMLDLLEFKRIEIADTEEGQNVFYVSLWK